MLQHVVSLLGIATMRFNVTLNVIRDVKSNNRIRRRANEIFFLIVT